MTHAENQLTALLKAIELITGINYGQRIEELETQNVALLEALKDTQRLLDDIYAEDIVSSGDLGLIYEQNKQALAQIK